MKTGMDFRGLVWKRVWKMFFGLKSGQDLENRAAHPHQEFLEIPLAGLFATSKIMFRRHICLSRISACVIYVLNFFAYFKFHSDWGRVTGKIKQNELDCRDTVPLKRHPYVRSISFSYRIEVWIIIFHMTSLKFKLKNYQSYRDFTFTMH